MADGSPTLPMVEKPTAITHSKPQMVISSHTTTGILRMPSVSHFVWTEMWPHSRRSLFKAMFHLRTVYSLNRRNPRRLKCAVSRSSHGALALNSPDPSPEWLTHHWSERASHVALNH